MVPQVQVPSSQSFVRSVELTPSGEICVEKFKDLSGKIVKQQSFTKEMLLSAKDILQKQFTEASTRLDEMLSLFQG